MSDFKHILFFDDVERVLSDGFMERLRKTISEGLGSEPDTDESPINNTEILAYYNIPLSSKNNLRRWSDSLKRSEELDWWSEFNVNVTGNLCGKIMVFCDYIFDEWVGDKKPNVEDIARKMKEYAESKSDVTIIFILYSAMDWVAAREFAEKTLQHYNNTEKGFIVMNEVLNLSQYSVANSHNRLRGYLRDNKERILKAERS